MRPMRNSSLPGAQLLARGSGPFTSARAILGLLLILAVVCGTTPLLQLVNAFSGTLDTSFDADGLVTTDFGGGGVEEGRAVAVQPDGKIVVAGGIRSGPPTYDNFALTRYNSDGSLDTSFDGDGKAVTDFGLQDFALDVAIQVDGKIVVVGQADVNFSGQPDFAVARYNTDGSLDTSFDVDGKATTAVSAFGDEAYAVAIQSDKIVVGGAALVEPNTSRRDFALVRYNPDGTLDTTFGSNGNGIETTALGTSCGNSSSFLLDIALQADGQIIAAGRAHRDCPDTLMIAIVRYSTNGLVGQTAFTRFGGPGTRSAGNAVVVQRHGQIVVAGSTDAGGTGDFDFALVRYDSNLNLDVTFGNSGQVTTSVGPLRDEIQDITLQPDDKIVVGGLTVTDPYPIRDFALARYNSDGTLDTSFDADGIVTTHFGTRDDAAYGVALQPDGKIVAAGWADQPIPNSSQMDFAVARYLGSAPLPTLSIADVTVTEGDSGPTNAEFTVTLSTAVNQTVTVDFATAGGTAVAGADYTSTNGTLTFGPQETTKVITVLVNADAVHEPTETFVIDLSNPTGVTVADGQGQGTIGDDDPPLAIQAAGARVVVNNGPANQIDPHISGDWVSYTNANEALGWSIRLDNVATGVKWVIPIIGSSLDRQFLSDINGSKAVFTREDRSTGSMQEAIHLFDLARPNASRELDPAPSSQRRNPSIGGNTVAWQDHATAGIPEIVVHDLATGTTQRLTNDSLFDRNPAVSPDGSVVVWDKCATLDFFNCQVWQATAAAGVWTAAPLATGSSSAFPDTNGQLVVYQSVATVDGIRVSDIQWQPVGGGLEQGFTLPGHERHVAISGNVIAFEHDVQGLGGGAEIMLYDMSAGLLYQLTNTPGINDSLADISVTANSNRVRVVYNAEEPDFNVYVITLYLSQLSIDDVAILEGDGGTGNQARFSVRMTVPSPQTVTVDYVTTAGTATAGADYQSASGQITFNPGETLKALIVSIDGDAVREPDETYFVDLVNATNATISKGRGVGTIRNDDDISADLAIFKSASPDPVMVGRNLTYTLVVTNLGPDTATGVEVRDVLPAGVTFQSVAISEGTCEHAAGTIDCDLGTLATGARASITIVVRPTTAGTITNSAAVRGNEHDPCADSIIESQGCNNNVAQQQTTVARPSNGKIAFSSNRNGETEIYSMYADGTNLMQLTSAPFGEFNPSDIGPAWSPDGTKIAFTRFRQFDYYDIYVMNADGTNQTSLTSTDAVYDVDPSWSPDGSRIAFTSFRDGNFDIYTMDSDGNNQTRLTNDSFVDQQPAWSPDGTKIAFVSFRNDNREIYMMNVDGTGQTRLTNNSADDYDPAWSPDGTKLVFTSERDGNREIYVISADETNQTRLTDTITADDQQPAWSPDGTKIAFVTNRDGSARIYLMNPDGTSQTSLAVGFAAYGPDWQLDMSGNNPPDATDDGAQAEEDSAVRVTDVLGNDTDPDAGQTLTVTSFTQAGNGTVVDIGSNEFAYTPNPNFNGTDSFTYSVSDGNGGSDTATVNVLVMPVNDTPTAVGDVYELDEDSSLSIAGPGVLGNDGDIDGDALNASLVSTTSSGSLSLNADGSFTYSPRANFNGTDSFSYRAGDGTADSNNVTVTITVNPVPDPPEAIDDTATIQEDTTVMIDVLANDSDADGEPLTTVLISDPSNGTAVPIGDGSFTYRPNSNFYGNESFNYWALDGSLAASLATVNITIIPVNDAPSAIDDVATTPQDTPAEIRPLNNDSDIDGDSLIILTLDSVAVGTATVAGNSLLYSPSPGFVGTDVFTYTVSDGNGGFDTATITVIVTDTTPPVLSVPADMTVNATSPAGAIVSYIVTAMDNVAVTSLTCSPPSGSVFPIGTTVVSCTASDAAGNTSTRTFRVTVKGAAAQILDLIQFVSSQISNNFLIPPIIRAQILAALQTALANPQNVPATCQALNNFISFIQSPAAAFIPRSAVQQMIADATRIRAVLSCP